MSQVITVLAGFFSGMLGSFQGTVNSQLGKEWSLPAMIFAVSLVQCGIALTWLILSRTFILAVLTEWRVFIAGTSGVLIMSGVAWSVSKNGVLTTFILVIFGQLLFSSMVDFFGLFGVMQRIMTPTRVLSLGLIGLGVFLLAKWN